MKLWEERLHANTNFSFTSRPFSIRRLANGKPTVWRMVFFLVDHENSLASYVMISYLTLLSDVFSTAPTHEMPGQPSWEHQSAPHSGLIHSSSGEDEEDMGEDYLKCHIKSKGP